MTADFTIRTAQPNDIPDILRLVRGLAEYEHMLDHVTATEATLHEILFAAVPRAQAIVAETERGVAGLGLFYYTVSTFSGRRNIFLEDLFVEPAHRGARIGLALMRHLAQRAVAERCGRIEWRVLTWNQPAIDFYQRIGSEPVTDWQTRQLAGDGLVALAEGTSHG
jgi:GNAT superfamily N-acetyltransferase